MASSRARAARYCETNTGNEEVARGYRERAVKLYEMHGVLVKVESILVESLEIGASWAAAEKLL